MADDASVSLSPRSGLLQFANLGAYHGNSVRRFLRWVAVLIGGASVKSMALTSPPGSPADNDAYIVGTAATGAWSGHDGEVAVWFTEFPGTDNDTLTPAWDFMTPQKGIEVYNEADDKKYVWSGAAWDVLALHVGP